MPAWADIFKVLFVFCCGLTSFPIMILVFLAAQQTITGTNKSGKDLNLGDAVVLQEKK